MCGGQGHLGPTWQTNCCRALRSQKSEKHLFLKKVIYLKCICLNLQTRRWREQKKRVGEEEGKNEAKGRTSWAAGRVKKNKRLFTDWRIEIHSLNWRWHKKWLTEKIVCVCVCVIIKTDNSRKKVFTSLSTRQVKPHTKSRPVQYNSFPFL